MNTPKHLQYPNPHTQQPAQGLELRRWYNFPRCDYETRPRSTRSNTKSLATGDIFELLLGETYQPASSISLNILRRSLRVPTAKV